jgi:integrase/recombinase XerD
MTTARTWGRDRVSRARPTPLIAISNDATAIDLQPAPAPRRGDLDPIFESYLDAQARRRCTPGTIRTTRNSLLKLQRWLDRYDIRAANLGLLDCERYFDQLLDQYAHATVRQDLAYVRGAYRYAHRHHYVGHDPTTDVRLPWPQDREPATYSNDQLRAIYAAIRNEREELAFHLFAFAGLRLGEASRLAWDNIDLEQRQMKFTGKGGKFRLVPIHPALESLLREHEPRRTAERTNVITSLSGKPLGSINLGGAVRRLVDRAQVEIDQPTHAFRRTVATVMYEHGVRNRVIERIMGWAPRLMHERHYLRVADKPMRDAILTLYHDDPVSDRQRPRVAPADETRTAGVDLSVETAILDQIDARLRREAGTGG